MIAESFYWRRELYDSASKIRVKATQLKWREASFYRVEREFMLGCYAIRRLIDSLKVPADLNGHQIPVMRLAAKPVDRARFRFAPPIDLIAAAQMFDFQSPKATTLKVRDLLNAAIHSAIFFCLPPAEGIVDETMLFVASDRDKRTHLNCLWLSEAALLFEKAALLDVTELTIRWSPKDDDFVATTKGKMDDRLSGWGIETPGAIAATKVRLKTHRDLGELKVPLALLHQAATEYDGT
jgi:hypothetical protein